MSKVAGRCYVQRSTMASFTHFNDALMRPECMRGWEGCMNKSWYALKTLEPGRNRQDGNRSRETGCTCAMLSRLSTSPKVIILADTRH